jgi:hypothetical protein
VSDLNQGTLVINRKRNSGEARSILGLLSLILLVFFTGCSAQATYNRVPTTGRFSGEPRMVALAPNVFFFFQPKQDEKFAFTTHLPTDPASSEKSGRGKYRWSSFRIEPEEMITDGASIPRNLWYISGFAPFDFTRAAVIHDWLYEAHHRYDMATDALAAAQKRHDVEAINRNRADVEAYKSYAALDQDDAADIFAECIKVTMIQSHDIVEAVDRYSAQQPDPGNASSEPFHQLEGSLRHNQPSPTKLWMYHYFVSRDSIIKASKQHWDEKHATLETYRFLTSDPVKKIALEKGYLSPWLIRRFKAILAREEKRHRDYQLSQKQATSTINTSGSGSFRPAGKPSRSAAKAGGH